MDRGTGQPAFEHVEIDHPWFSNDLMPVYRWTFPAEATDEELAASLRAREDWAVRARHPMAWVIDLSNVTKAPPTQRKALAEHLERFGELSTRWYVGAAIIVPSPWLRGVATAVTWLWPPKFPYELFSDPIEAQRWAEQRLAAKRQKLNEGR